MSTEYTFTKTVTKPSAFNAYIKEKNPLCLGFIGNGDSVTIATSTPLSDVQVTQLQSDVAAYVDPPYFLILDHTESIPFTSAITSSSNLTSLQAYIDSPPDPDSNTVCDSIKTIIEYSTSNVESFSNWNSNVDPLIVSFQIYCYTDKNVLVSMSNVVNEIGQKWKDDAINGVTGCSQQWKSLQVTGMKDKYPGSNDCIRQYMLAISNSNVRIKMNGLQKLFYVVE